MFSGLQVFCHPPLSSAVTFNHKRFCSWLLLLELKSQLLQSGPWTGTEHFSYLGEENKKVGRTQREAFTDMSNLCETGKEKWAWVRGQFKFLPTVT